MDEKRGLRGRLAAAITTVVAGTALSMPGCFNEATGSLPTPGLDKGTFGHVSPPVEGELVADVPSVPRVLWRWLLGEESLPPV